MLQNAPFLAIVAVDTDENAPHKVRQCRQLSSTHHRRNATGEESPPVASQTQATLRRLTMSPGPTSWKFRRDLILKLSTKDTIETMKWTNELFHQFRKYQQISQKLENFLQINIFFVFSENCWTFREILGKIHQNFAEKWQNFESFRKIFRKNAKKSRSFFAENLRSERCKGMQIL